MIENYFPNAADFDEMANHLASIASALGERVDISTWSGIQRAVQMGVAPTVLPVGTQLSVNHSVYGTKKYVVVAHNHFKDAKDDTAPTMTLMCQEVLLPSNNRNSYNPLPTSYDVREAFYYVDKELPAGTYNFTVPYAVDGLGAGTYYFTSPTLPVGTMLHFASLSDDEATIILAENFQTPISINDMHVSKGNVGTSLGAFSVELNHFERVLYGSNNYKESGVHQYLNSDVAKSTEYAPLTKYDIPSLITYMNGGFLNGLDANLRSTLVDVIIPCSANNTYESPDSDTKAGESYTVIDKVFLPSTRELGYKSNSFATDSTLPYFKNATNEMRIRYYNSVPRRYWTRVPESRSSFGVECINIDGSMVNIPAVNESGIVPMFNIG